MNHESLHKYLLILACSSRKRPDQIPIPAIDRYEGVNYNVLQKARREGSLPPNLDILILSAKYGLLHPDTPISHYDLKMTPQRAKALQGEISNALDTHLSNNHYRALFINLGRTYFVALACSQQLSHVHTSITFAHGGIGQRMAQMKRWLLDISYAE
jgi:cytoplasmic iron level regulating protein YaaA (DUF328/UPF0246 family)